MLAGCVALLLVTGAARANGRFPAASQLVVDGADADHLVARTTYGVVQSTDGGRSWRWTCEAAVGYSGRFDPAIAIASGAIVAGLPNGLSRSSDRACTWERAGDPLAGHWVVDVALDRGDAAHVVAVAQASDTSQPGFQATFADSRDAGRTWRAGAPLPEDLSPATVDVAPSRPSRVYVSGVGAFPLFGVVARSDDGGATWSPSSFDMHGAKAPYIAAIDPADADRVYLRLETDAGDRLALSTNAGTTWKDVFTATGSLLAFALSPDGARVAIGGPTDGVWVASTTDLAFAKRSGVAARCLTWSARGLYACGTESSDGFAIGLSTDDARTFAPLYRGRDLAPLACGATTTGAACADAWPPVGALLGQDAGADASAPVADAGAPPRVGDVAVSGGCAVRGDAAGAWAIVIAMGAARRARGVRGRRPPRDR